MTQSNTYQVTARKWRPTEFNSVAGQEHITQTLRNALNNNRIHHAYLFSGPRGVGKTTTARILARALNCLNPAEDGNPCGECESCRSIAEGRSMDVVEIDGASNNSVEDVRVLRDNAKYPPVTGRYKLYIIDEVHMLSTSAFNALLKTLEEPPSHLIFVFATTEPHKVLPTILSRCQRFDFRRMQIEDIVARLQFIAEQEGMRPEEDGLVVIARKADGSMRDAQSIFDQVVSFCGSDFSYAEVNSALNLIDQEFYFKVTDMMRAHQPQIAFEIVNYCMRIGYDTNEFLIGLAEHFRHILSVQSTGTTGLIETTSSLRERYEEEAGRLTQGDVIRALHLILAVQRDIRSASQPRLRVELLLIQLAVMDSTVRLDDLLNAIKGVPENATIVVPSESNPTSPQSGSRVGSSTAQAEAKTSSSSGLESGEGTSLQSAESTIKNVTSDAEQIESPNEVNSPAAEHNVDQDASDSNVNRDHDPLEHLRTFPTKTPVRTRSVGTPSPDNAPTNGNGNGSVENGNGAGSLSMMTIDEVASRWDGFRQYYSAKMTLMYALEPATPVEIQGNVLQLCVENEHQRNLIDQYRDDITTSIQTFFKRPFVIEGVIGRATRSAKMTTPDNEARVGSTPYDDHPFVKGIVELLGAVSIG